MLGPLRAESERTNEEGYACEPDTRFARSSVECRHRATERSNSCRARSESVTEAKG